MSELCRKNSRRIFAVLMAVILLAIMFFAVSLITENLEHDCTGDHCPVCECIQVCQSVIRQTGTGPVPVICLMLSLFAVYTAFVCFSAGFLPQNLITLKIRLNL